MPESRARAKTPWIVRNFFNPIFLRTGGMPIVAGRGRRTGKPWRTPINVVELDGAQYLVSPRGETGWSRNLRVTGECSLRMKGQERRYRATEVPPNDRPRIIAAYLDKYSRGTRAQFDALPDPADHPTFRLDAI